MFRHYWEGRFVQQNLQRTLTVHQCCPIVPLYDKLSVTIPLSPHLQVTLARSMSAVQLTEIPTSTQFSWPCPLATPTPELLLCQHFSAVRSTLEQTPHSLPHPLALRVCPGERRRGGRGGGRRGHTVMPVSSLREIWPQTE